LVRTEKGEGQERLTAAELATFLGISARAVEELGKRGIAIKAAPGCWRLKESVARYCDDLRRQVRAAGGVGVAASVAAEGPSSERASRPALALKNARPTGLPDRF
jgi:hypothetical protein